MSIIAEYCPELCLREISAPNREPNECIPQNLEQNKTYSFLKKGQRHYWLNGEIPLRKTKGNEILSKPIASIIILESTHFLKNNEVWTKGTYKVIETYNPEDSTIHFEGFDKLKKTLKIFIICSKHFYHRVNEIKEKLEQQGHSITLPNSFEQPFKEEEMKKLSPEEHQQWKQEMMKLHEPKVKSNDAVLVLNFEKNGKPNYIGGGTFMEIVKAWELNKKIFFFNEIPDNIFTDEIKGIKPIIINQDLSKIK